MTLNDAIAIALKNRLELSISDMSIYKSKALLEEARSEMYPRLDLVGNSRYTNTIEKFEPVQISFDVLGTKQTISPTKDVPEYQSDVTLQATQRLFTGGRVSGRIKGENARVGQDETAKEISRRDVVLAVIKAYWELKRAVKVLDIEIEKVKQSEIILSVAKARYEKGAIAGLEWEKAEVDMVNNKGDLLQAETSRKIAEDRLLKEMGIIETDKEVGLIPLDEPAYNASQPDVALIARPVQSRPEIKQLEKRIMASEAEVKVSKADYYPHVDLTGEYNWIGWDKNSVDGAWREMDRNYWAVFLKVNFNLFEGFATNSRVKQAKAEAEASRLELEKERRIIAANVRVAYNSMVGAAERIDTLKKSLSLAGKNLEVAKKQFELGVMTINQVAEYNLSMADTQKRYLNAIIDFEVARREYRWALGEDMT